MTETTKGHFASIIRDLVLTCVEVAGVQTQTNVSLVPHMPAGKLIKIMQV